MSSILYAQRRQPTRKAGNRREDDHHSKGCQIAGPRRFATMAKCAGPKRELRSHRSTLAKTGSPGSRLRECEPRFDVSRNGYVRASWFPLHH
jgi:hypothetical protein